MKTIKNYLLLALTIGFTSFSQSQNTTVISSPEENQEQIESTENNPKEKKQTNFMVNVRFGGAIYLSYSSSDYFNLGASPTAIYDFNKYFSAGASITYIYSKYETRTIDFSSHNYGGSIIALLNPTNKIQISAEYEQLKVDYTNSSFEDYWAPALYIGAAYRIQNISVGVRYDTLYENGRSIYSSEWSPFIRFYF